MKTFISTLGLVVGLAMLTAGPASAYPRECVTTYGYSAAACRCSYRVHPQGSLSTSKRRASLNACGKRKRTTKKRSRRKSK